MCGDAGGLCTCRSAIFQEAIMGIQEIAGMMEYDLLLCIGSGNDMAGLRRIIQNHKVDGVVLLRTMVDDPQVTFLQERRIPFVTAGSCKYKDVKQIDHDHRSACRELTSIMLMRGMKIWRFSVEARILL